MGQVSRRNVTMSAVLLALPNCRRAEDAEMLRRADGASTPAIFVGPRTTGAPVAVFSHGLGARGDVFLWLAEPLAARGFLCVLPTHRESSGGALRDAFRNAAARGGERASIADKVSDPALERDRSEDIAAALAAAMRAPTCCVPFE